MANPHPTPHTTKLPRLTCTKCGKTKIATRFPKKGGPLYERLKPSDPMRYAKQCKLCKKPWPSNPPPNYIHKEPVRAYRKKKLKRKKRVAPETVEERRERLRKTKARTRVETRLKSMQYLANKGCYECGERDPRKLEYDHRDPATKSVGISRLIVDGYTWSSPILRREIRKCRVLCANCHRVHTIKQQGYYAAVAVKRCLVDLSEKFEFKI